MNKILEGSQHQAPTEPVNNNNNDGLHQNNTLSNMINNNAITGNSNNNYPSNSASNLPSISVFQSSKIDDLFLAMKIIASIKPDEKIYTSFDTIDIKVGKSFLDSFIRFITGQSRLKNIEFIRSTVYEMFRFIETGLQEQERLIKINASTLESRELITMRLRNKQNIQRAKVSLEESLVGIRNLAKTYQSDNRTCAFISLLEEKILDYLKQINVGLQCIAEIININNINANTNGTSGPIPVPKQNAQTYSASAETHDNNENYPPALRCIFTVPHAQQQNSPPTPVFRPGSHQSNASHASHTSNQSSGSNEILRQSPQQNGYNGSTYDRAFQKFSLTAASNATTAATEAKG